ncbi:hypothetical protein D3C84_945720 [compost metagenome]
MSACNRCNVPFTTNKDTQLFCNECSTKYWEFIDNGWGKEGHLFEGSDKTLIPQLADRGIKSKEV